jgi:BlaI family penicillinase repressor
MSTKSISDAEWIVMEIIWRNHPITANEIIKTLSSSGEKKWNPRTVKTLLSRLVNKEILSFSQEGRLYKYEPLVNREKTVRKERNSFLSKIYKGSVSPMLAAFIKDSELSQSEISELKELLNKKEEEIGNS